MNMHSLMITVRILVLPILFLSLVIVPHSSSVSFNLPDFSDCNTVGKNIDYELGSSCANGVISLTTEAPWKNLTSSTGRATYKQPVVLWEEDSGEVTNFTTKFSFIIRSVDNGQQIADGFTLFLAPYQAEIPQNANISGGFLGLFEHTTAFNASMNQIVALEFDTFNNYDIDPDGIGCHVGIDINTITSTTYMSMTSGPNDSITGQASCFFVDSNMTAQIEYNSGINQLNLHLWRNDDPDNKFNLNATVDIRRVLPNKAVIGFSAATGQLFEYHQIFSWSFESTLEVRQNKFSPPPASIDVSPPPDLPPSSSSSHNSRSWSVSTIGGIGTGVFLILILTGFLIYSVKRKRSIRNTNETELIDFEFEKGNGPKKFNHRELVDATNGFAEKNKLGEGGFGSVYSGVLMNGNIHVAVKRVSKESKQGKKEYISEVKIISQLRHRNLVQLVGWCHDRGELLLVYELMHNGSLDTHLYCNDSLLAWPIRQNIALGLGHALLYLHEECELCVVHRDIKPSNIMLDSSFNAKLGDFGLARLTDHHRDLRTTIVAGTNGYMAPEYILGIENASTQSDVFSFGVVLLEMVCGRWPIMHQQDQKKVNLVEWVWDLYGQNMLIEAVDGRLNGNFERNEVECFMVVGLWCAYPEKSLRPSIRQAMSVLQFQAGLPILPPKMPVPVYAAPVYPGMQLCTSSEATSSGVESTSTKSAPVRSSDSSWLLKQQANTM